MGDLISTLVGGALTLAGGFAAKTYTDWRQAGNLRSAFSGELRSMLAEYSRMNFIPLLEAKIAEIEQYRANKFFQAVLDPGFNTVFLSNASALGSLRSPLPEKIVTVYRRAATVKQILDIFNTYPESHAPFHDDTEGLILADHRKLLQRIHEVIDLATKLINDLDGVAENYQSPR